MGALTSQDYADALYAQSACNLSGIVTSLSKVMPKIWEDVRAAGQGTEQVNRHAIPRLYAEQIAHLTGAGMPVHGESDYGEAYEACEKGALKVLKPGAKPPWRFAHVG